MEEGSDAISREAPVEDHWAQVTSRRFPSPALDCRSKYWRALLQKLALCEHYVIRLGISHRVIAPADSALADIEQNQGYSTCGFFCEFCIEFTLNSKL